MAQAQQRITRDDLEAKFRAVQDDIQGKVDDRKQTIVVGALVGGFVLLFVFFLLGRRSGKGKTTLVEIRRV
jgi:hypoxanthine-guanine phosphoribosyltransferase